MHQIKHYASNVILLIDFEWSKVTKFECKYKSAQYAVFAGPKQIRCGGLVASAPDKKSRDPKFSSSRGVGILFVQMPLFG